MSGQGGRDRGRGRGRGGFDPGSRGGPGRGRGGFDRGRGGFDRGRGGGRGGGRGAAEIQVFSLPGEPNPTPDPQVSKLEDFIAKSRPTGLPEIGSLGVGDVSFPSRPGYGTLGAKTVLRANYFELQPAAGVILYRYHADIQPQAKGKKLKRIFALLLEDDIFAEVRGKVATDHTATIICRGQLAQERTRISVPYRAEDEESLRENATVYIVSIQETGSITLSELMDFVRSTNANAIYNGKDQAIQALNIIMSRSPGMNPNVVTLGRNKFYPTGASRTRSELSATLEVIKGYYSSVRAATGRILLNVNVSHAVFYRPDRLDALIDGFRQEHGRNPISLQKFLKGVRVQVTHLQARKDKNGQPIKRIKTIFGLANKNDGHGQAKPVKVANFGCGAKEVEFFQGDRPGQKQSTKPGAKAAPNRYVSVFQFFLKEYGITITNPALPVVNVGNRENPVYLPAQVCTVLSGQVSKAALSGTSTDTMMRFSARRPWENAQSIIGEGSTVIGLLPPANASLGPLGISVTPKMITVPARVLGGPSVKYRANESKISPNGSWNLVKIKFTTGAKIGNWSCLWLPMQGMDYGTFSQEGPWQTVEKFHEVLLDNGITVPRPMLPGLRCDLIKDDNTENDKRIGDAFKKFYTHPGKPKLILVIIPFKGMGTAAIYNRVKYIADIKAGIHTVCVIGHKFGKRDDQYFRNVGMKFNLKFGGINHSLDANKLGIISGGSTMVVGIDVTHPSPGSAPTAPSVAGIVASIDKHLAQWPADLRIQEARKEMVSDLDGLLKGRLELWRTRNKDLPKNILVYRDGVSEGQYQKVILEELPLLRAACASIYPATDTKKGLPRMSIIVVGKRHHTRFYPVKVEDCDRSSNTKNGTIVDRGVTEAQNWDFFLQAHTCLQGTARPAHYFIVLDEIFRNGPAPAGQTQADALEQLTHNMCYLFGRATKAVSICPPAYYADLVCERARCYLASLFSPETPGATPAQSVASGPPQPQASAAEVAIHPDLKNSMFYI